MQNYDGLAEAYAAENETSLMNAHYERPAMLDLAGDVAGRRVLDAGCGAGPLFAALRERGATVSGFDVSAGMVEQARLRLGDDADLNVADLGEPLPYEDDSFDDVLASLVLHYLRDWAPVLAEVRRVLKPGGRLIVSVDNPFAIVLLQRQAGENASYFATEQRVEEWTIGGHTAKLTFWNRPLHAMTDSFTAAGFRIAKVHEAKPVAAARELFPEDFDSLNAFPGFLFFVLEALEA
ncbi:class I SAM-dependent methyltransferase [Allokutzneria sp. NRRL B-24872]|uniref:class I SAM-dependent methyltransferase n=1 Tax=Allokutzneria sp. NRRL B-24872 TaxID=1137961 RepID=UPI000A38E5C3|nr:class I SAM-dependent methyltransferase [Allokutzneria sp. NRRL B-24872]